MAQPDRMKSHAIIFLWVVSIATFMLGVGFSASLVKAENEHSVATPSGFSIFKSIATSPEESGVDGFIQVLQDERVTLEYRKIWSESGQPEYVLGQEDPLISSLNSTPVRNGHLRILDVRGKVILDEMLYSPICDIRQEFLYGTKFPTYLVTVDPGSNGGSYNGPTTMFVEIRRGKVRYIQPAEIRAVEDIRKQPDRMWLMESLKSAWRIVPAANGVQKEIQRVECHRAKGNVNEFVVIYFTYRFKNGKWHRTSRNEVGFWENEGDWPPRSEFP